ncbi:MAG: hypothetical protein ABJA82_06760 [Myxococcales bacterium]
MLIYRAVSPPNGKYPLLLVLAAVLLTPATLVWRGGGRAQAAEGIPNACGCYQDATGSCYCGKKARCGCPGDCEPKGCEEKREKELRKEIDAETKKAQEAGRRYLKASEENGAHGAGRAAAGEGRQGDGDMGGDGHKMKAVQERKATAHLTAGQRKELLRLLDLYAAEHADHAGRTIDQLRGELTTSAP